MLFKLTAESSLLKQTPGVKHLNNFLIKTYFKWTNGH